VLRALLLAASAATLAGTSLEVVSTHRGRGFELRPLAIEFLGGERFLALSADELALYALDSAGAAALLSRAPLPGPFFAVRAPAGMLRVASADAACWAMTNGMHDALLYAVEGNRLLLRERAAALPWPGAPAGLRYLPGTNVLERGDERLARVAEGGWAVMDDGTLLQADRAGGLRVGTALAPLWEPFALASAPLPPGQGDALLLLERGAAGAAIAETLPVDGSIRALAAQVAGRRARVVVAVEPSEAGLLVLEFRAREP
jgi:hypothetical protein